MFVRNLRRWVAENCLAWLSLLVLAAASPVRAERPTAPYLLPEKTLAYLRITDTRDFVARFNETMIGRMSNDEQVRPLVSKLYGSAAELFGRVQDQVGLPLEKILAIPQGEICIAVLAPDKGPPQIVALIEVGDQLRSAQKLLDRAAEEMEKNGTTKTTEAVGDTKLNIYDPPGNQPEAIVQFEKDGVIAIATSVDAAKQLLTFWSGQKPTKDGQEIASLADNRKFTSIMNRCGGTKDERPQITFYVDPIELVRTIARGNAGLQTGMAFLPMLGLDGVQGLGGSMFLNAGEFDSIQHIHLLLDNPRSGVVKALALTAGDSTPEPFVPNDVLTYMTFHWDVPTTYKEVDRLLATFQGEGALARLTKSRISEPLGLDFDKDLIGAMEGRFSYFSWVEKPVRLNSQTQMLAIKLKDANAFRGTLEQIFAKFPDAAEKKSFGSTNYYRIKTPNNPNQNPVLEIQRQRNQQRVQMGLRLPEPCLAILGDYLVGSDSSALIHQAITTQSDASKSLANELDFKLIASKISRQVGGNKPGMVVFNRPEESLRFLYDLATADETRNALNARSGENEFFKTIDGALKEHPLPPFSVLQKYLAPGGGMVTSDETGFHYTAFALKRK